MNKLTILTKRLPLRAYPEEALNEGVMVLYEWLCGVLSLTGQESKERLKNAFPAVKEQCIGMGFSDIKEMFELYADGKLDIEPISNYFDRVLLGKIIKSYRSYKNRLNKKPVDTDQYKKEKDHKEIEFYFNEYQKNKKIYNGWEWAYTYLESKGVIKTSGKEKIRLHKHYSSILKEEENIIKLCKQSLLRDFFDKLIHDKKNITFFLGGL